MVGVFYQDDTFDNAQTTVIGANPVPDVGAFELTGETISPFAQFNFDFTDKLSLSAGVRYTDETKEQDNRLYGDQLASEVSFQNWSPEVTLSYKPTIDSNLYLSYREGYKSGGFQTEFVSIPSALAAGLSVDNSYDEETVRGFEVGAKALILDGAMNLSAAAFMYEYEGLQLGRFDPLLVTTIIDNIGSSEASGAELEIDYLTPVDGLRLDAALAYTKSEYEEFLAACYTGQSTAAGCDPTTNLQDLSGEALPRAPEWSGTLGATYENDLTASIGYRLSGAITYSDEYELTAEVIPGSTQDAYATYDAGLALFDADQRWELALIGKNLSDEYWGSSAGQVPATGPGLRSDLFTTVNRGRQVLVRVMYRPTN